MKISIRSRSRGRWVHGWARMSSLPDGCTVWSWLSVLALAWSIYVRLLKDLGPSFERSKPIALGFWENRWWFRGDEAQFALEGVHRSFCTLPSSFHGTAVPKTLREAANTQVQVLRRAETVRRYAGVEVPGGVSSNSKDWAFCHINGAALTYHQFGARRLRGTCLTYRSPTKLSTLLLNICSHVLSIFRAVGETVKTGTLHLSWEQTRGI